MTTLRDQFAISVMPSVYSPHRPPEQIAALSYAHADAMMACRLPPITDLPDFEHPIVLGVYKILADDCAEQKPPDEHWEGWVARRIVAFLSTVVELNNDQPK